jgi:hypothetical protein
MSSPIMSGDPQAQGYIRQRYAQLREAGYSKSEAHTIAFNELRAMSERAQEQPQDPYNSVVYSDQPGF